MEQTFDFEKNGKQMPYTVPDGFFDTLEENVMKEWKEESGMEREKKRAKTIRIAIRTVLAIAACLALFFIVRSTQLHDNTATDDFDNVELAFNNLSTEDQDYFLDTFEDDLFMDNNDLN